MAMATTSSLSISSLLTNKSLLLDKPIAVATSLPVFRKAQISCFVGERKEPKAVKDVGKECYNLGAFANVLAVADSHLAFALVDERLSTEGTGLDLGISNPILIWIILGVFTLIWSLYFDYSSSLPSGDDDSGLSL